MSLQSEIQDGQVRVRRWDVGTLAWIAWDGALTTGAVTIGAVTQSGNWNVGITGAVSLPTNASQETGGNLATIATNTGKIPALGQALAAASTPVVLTAAQLTTLTPPAAITNFALDATLTGGTQKTKLVDAGGTNVASVGATGALASNVAQLAGTTTSVNSGTKDAGTLRVVLATDQPALTNKLLVTPDSVALPANQSVNLNQIAGTAADTNSGTKSAGTLRVVLATDQPALTNKLLVTPDSVALPANQSTNVNQFGGSAVVTGTGASGAGVPRVTVSNDSTILGPTLTKGTQGSTGYSVQDLKDAGRTQLCFYATGVTAGTSATEAMISLIKVGTVGGAAPAGATSFTVTSGKRFRITAVMGGVRNMAATTATATFTLRVNASGATIATSTGIAWQFRTAVGATINSWDRAYMDLLEGMEILGDGTLTFGVSVNPVWTTTAAQYDFTMVGYEY